MDTKDGKKGTGIALGISIGLCAVVIGLLMDNMPLGMGIGIGGAMVVGTILNKNEK